MRRYSIANHRTPTRETLLVLSHLLKLAHLSLGSSFSNESHPAVTNSLSITLTLLNVDHKTRCLLEFHISQAQAHCSLLVPILGRNLDSLCWFGIVGLVEVEVMSAVDIQVNVAGPHHVFVVLGREGSELLYAVSQCRTWCNVKGQ